MYDRNSWTPPWPICLKFRSGNSWEPRECSWLGFEFLNWVGPPFKGKIAKIVIHVQARVNDGRSYTYPGAASLGSKACIKFICTFVIFFLGGGGEDLGAERRFFARLSLICLFCFQGVNSVNVNMLKNEKIFWIANTWEQI